MQVVSKVYPWGVNMCGPVTGSEMGADGACAVGLALEWDTWLLGKERFRITKCCYDWGEF